MAPRSDSQYPADWQLQCGELKQRGEHLLKSGVWSDCCFSFVEVTIKAHKLILAMASPVFEAMFYGPIAEGGNNAIPIPDMHPETFNGLLEYIYTDNIEIDSFDKACNLYYGAQKYMLTHLLTVCTMYLSCNLTPDLACQMYEFALLVGEDALAKECEEMIISETSTILQMKGFKELSIETIEKIYSLNNLNITSELELFKAVECYAKSLDSSDTCDTIGNNSGTCGNEKFEESNNEFEEATPNKNVEEEDQNESSEGCKDTDAIDVDENDENLPDHNYCLAQSNVQGQEIGAERKRQLKKLLQKIRFLTVTPAELAEYPTLTSLLTESEILALIMNAASEKTPMPMPEGFSLSRTKR